MENNQDKNNRSQNSNYLYGFFRSRHFLTAMMFICVTIAAIVFQDREILRWYWFSVVLWMLYY